MNARKCVHAQMPLATPFRHSSMNQARSEEEKKKREKKKKERKKKEKERGQEADGNFRKAAQQNKNLSEGTKTRHSYL